MDIKKRPTKFDIAGSSNSANVTPFPNKNQTPEKNEHKRLELKKKLETNLEKTQDELLHLTLANALINTHLFENTESTELNIILSNSSVLDIPANEEIVKENSLAKYLYIIVEGEALVHKEARNELLSLNVEKLSKNDMIGLVPLFDKGPYSASVVAKTPIRLLRIPLDFLRNYLHRNENNHLYLTSATEALTKELRGVNRHYTKKITEVKIGETKLVNCTRLLISTLIGLSAYTIALANIHVLNSLFNVKEMITFGLTIMFVILSAIVIFRSERNLNKFGLSLKNSGKAIKDSLFYSLLMVAGLIIAKSLLITFYPAYSGLTLFSMQHYAPPLTIMMLYAFFIAPAQEFAVRCCLQSSLYLLLTSRHKTLISIVISNLLFSITHLTYSFTLVALSFVTGLFWGWLFSRTRSWLAVSISHAIIGTMFFGVICFPGLMARI